MLFASLVDDPDSDPTFRKADGTVDEERAGARRAELFNLIEELVKWENSNNESMLNRARAEIAACVEQFGMEDGPFGVAETLSKAKNTAVNGLVEAGIITARAGKVRLLKRDEIVVQASSLRERRAGKMPAPQDWNPAIDTRLRHWEIVQYLIRALETGGETAAADLLRKLGGMGEVARDLAYRLYNLCERKKWAQDALAYNSLVIAWPEISKLARSAARPMETQGEMF